MYQLLESELRTQTPAPAETVEETRPAGPIAPYREFLSVPGSARLLVGGLAGRLPLGMTSLSILLLIHLKTGSFATAGVAVGVFTLSSAATTPAQGRLIDRIGGPPVLIVFAIAQAAALSAVVIAAELKTGGAVLVIVSGIAGAMTPPLSASMRALWPRVTTSRAMLEAAYQLDAISQEVIWTTGPLLVALVVAAGSPAAAVLLSAAITVAGTLGFARAPATRRWRGVGRAARRASALVNHGLRIIVCTTSLMGIGIGMVEVALPGVAVHAGSHSGAGVLLGLWSIGSMAGGITYGSRAWRARMTSRYPALLLLVTVTTVPLILLTTFTAAIPLSLLAGVGYAPTLACQYTLVGALASTETATEAFAWTSMALVGGIAAGNAIAGPLVQAGGISRAFLFACLAFALAAAVAAAARKRVHVAVSHEHVSVTP
jgi:MFS family permease